jgi:hypothetical protein
MKKQKNKIYCVSSNKIDREDKETLRKIIEKDGLQISNSSDLIGLAKQYNMKISEKFDGVIEKFRKGCNGENLWFTDIDLDGAHKDGAIVLRGIAKKTLIWELQKRNHDFYFIDTGYLGNHTYHKNTNGLKKWHRITKKNMQQMKHIPRKSDRFDKLEIKQWPWKKTGRGILLCPPSQKTMNLYHMDLDTWVKDTKKEIKKYTDRPIIERLKVGRSHRIPMQESLMDDVFAMVTFNSIAACESVFFGIPCFINGPSAAEPMTLSDLSKIDEPIYPDREIWLNSLAYSQFTTEEIGNGTAWKILSET